MSLRHPNAAPSVLSAARGALPLSRRAQSPGSPRLAATALLVLPAVLAAPVVAPSAAALSVTSASLVPFSVSAVPQPRALTSQASAVVADGDATGDGRQRAVLGEGHVDVFTVVRADDGGLGLHARDVFAGEARMHDPKDVVLRVPQSAQVLAGANATDPAGVYVVPALGAPGVPSFGWDTSPVQGSSAGTSAPDRTVTPGDTAEQVNTTEPNNTVEPGDGVVSDVLIDVLTVDGPASVTLSLPAEPGGTAGGQDHDPMTLPGVITTGEPGRGLGTWTFAAAGTYTFTVQARATINGDEVESPAVTYVFVVGDDPAEAADDLDAAGTTSPAPQVPTPSATPTPENTAPADTPPPAPAPTSDESASPAVGTPAPTQGSEATTRTPGPATAARGPNATATPHRETPSDGHAAQDGDRTEAVTLAHGHTDLFNVSLRGDQLHLNLVEDITGSRVQRRPEAVTLRVAEKALTTMPQGYPAAGSDVYLLPLVQDPQLLWPGWNTMELSGTDVGPVTIDLETEGPGTVYLFGTKPFGGPASLLRGGSLALPGTLDVASPAHVHANWAFTDPGTYLVRATARTTRGVSRTATYTFVVGDGGSSAVTPGASAPHAASLGAVSPGEASPRQLGTTSPRGRRTTAKSSAARASAASPTRSAQAGGATPLSAEQCTQGTYVALPPQAKTHGHFDIGPRLVQDSHDGATLQLGVKDDTVSPPSWSDASTVTFGLGDAALKSAPADLNFLAPTGAPLWMVGSTQEPQVPWVGENTMHPSILEGTRGPVTWTVTSVDGPGDVAHFLAGPLGAGIGERLFDTVGGPTSFTVAPNTHQHGTWVFTQPGTYTLDVQQSAESVRGERLSGTGTVTFVVAGCQGMAPAVDAVAAVSDSTVGPTDRAGSAGAAAAKDPQPAGADYGVPNWVWYCIVGLLAALTAVHASWLGLALRRAQVLPPLRGLQRRRGTPATTSATS